MRKTLAVVLMMGTGLPVPAIASTAPVQWTEWPAASSGPDSSVHATRGVVQSIDATTLVLARPKHRGTIMFTLSPTLHRDGPILAGAAVSVRYRDDGTDHVATAISLQQPHK